MDTTIKALYALIEKANSEYNSHVDEFNELMDKFEASDEENDILRENIAGVQSLLVKQENVIRVAVKETEKDRAALNVISAQLKELQRLDPKRLVKQNKGYKTTIADLKTKLQNVEIARKAAIKNSKVLAENAVSQGNAAFHFDPKSKNAIRIIPKLYVGTDNTYGGLPKTPVVEFIHHERGITRQGMLSTTGNVVWAQASNSNPTNSESLVTKTFLLDWCNKNKIKVA